jgi:hypothetical protein
VRKVQKKTTHLKCRWEENRGDQHADWGCSWWYFEFGADGAIIRQVEIYDSGVRLRYGPDHLSDGFGKLGEGRLQDMDMPGAEVMTADEFEVLWNSSHRTDQTPREKHGVGFSVPNEE